MKRKSKPSSKRRKQRKLHELLDSLGREDKILRSRYRGECLLKAILPEQPCTKLVWNHTIGREFLRKVTSKNGHIQYWDIFSGKMLGIQSMGSGKIPGEKLPQGITEFEPSKFGIDNFHCQIQGACNRHDHKAFETIETPNLFKGNDPDHQARIAMRAAFAETALLSNTESWIGDQRRKHKSVILQWQIMKNHQQNSRLRLKSWLELITNNKVCQVSTEYLKEQLPVRMTACGTFNRTDVQAPATFSLMPRNDGLTDILISTKTDESGIRTQQQNEQTERLLGIVQTLREQPSDAIKQLIRMSDQIFLNPDDYNNRSIISEAEKSDLEEDIAQYRAEESLAMSQATGVFFGRQKSRHKPTAKPPNTKE